MLLYCSFPKEALTLPIGKSGTSCRDSAWEEVSLFRNYSFDTTHPQSLHFVRSLNIVTVQAICACLVSTTVLGTQQVLQNTVN